MFSRDSVFSSFPFQLCTERKQTTRIWIILIQNEFWTCRHLYLISKKKIQMAVIIKWWLVTIVVRFFSNFLAALQYTIKLMTKLVSSAPAIFKFHLCMQYVSFIYESIQSPWKRLNKIIDKFEKLFQKQFFAYCYATITQ